MAGADADRPQEGYEPGLMNRNSYPRSLRHVPLIKLMTFLLFLTLVTGYAGSLVTCGKDGAQHVGASGASENVDEAGHGLVTYNRTVSIGLLIGGSLFIVYCVKASSKAGRRRKPGIRRQIRRG